MHEAFRKVGVITDGADDSIADGIMTLMSVNPEMYWCKNGDDSNADDEDIDILKW